MWWYEFREGPLRTYGGYLLLGMLGLLVLFFLVRGRIRVEHGRAGATIESPLRVFILALGADDDDRDLGERVVALDGIQKLQAVHHWHVDVEQNEIDVGVLARAEAELDRFGERLAKVTGLPVRWVDARTVH